MSAVFLAAVAIGLQQNQTPPIKLRPPETKSEEKARLHSIDVEPMPMARRLRGYRQRLEMMEASPFQNIKWRSVGSEYHSGRVVDIHAPADDPNEILVAFATGGLWRTHTEGQTWEPLFDHESSFSIGDIAVSDDGETIWVGTGENNSQRTSYTGTGMFKSTDAGKTWVNKGLHDSHHIGRVLIHPDDEDTVFVASIGPLYSQGGQRGLYKTTDGGDSWETLLEIDKYTGIIDVNIDPEDPDTMYAVAWDRDRRAWNFREGGAGSAVYKSTDGGDNWKKLSGIPSGDALGRGDIAISPVDSDRLYFFIDGQDMQPLQDEVDENVASGTLTDRRFRYMTDEALKGLEDTVLRRFLRNKLPEETDLADTVEKAGKGEIGMAELTDLMLQRNKNVFNGRTRQGELWRSDDAGKTWVNASGPMGSHGGYYWTQVIAHPTEKDTLFTIGLLLLRSTDGGESWESVGRRNHVDHHEVWIDPTNPDRMINGNDGGPYLTLDGAKTWRHLNNLAVGQWTTLGIDTAEPYNIYGGLQDNGTVKGPSTHVSGSSRITNWVGIGGGDGSAIAIDPRDGGRYIYTASQFGNHTGQDQETGARWRIRPRASKPGEVLRFNWISPILISPHHPDIIYLGSQKVHRSFNQGKAFEDLGGDITKNLPNGDVPFSTLTVLAESYHKFGQIWAGADDGTIKYTPDSGLNWIDVSTPQPDRWVTRIVASKHKAGRVYACQNGYRQDEWNPYVWTSDDNGETWESISANLPYEPVNTVREDPENENILYVGTDIGVYVSRDRGESWMTYGTGIPSAPIHDLLIHEREHEMIVATHSRSAWVIDVSPLQDLTDEMAAKPLHLFPVSGMNRMNWEHSRRSSWDKRPAQDRSLTGQFWAGKAGAGTVSVVDEDGKTVVSMQVEANYGYNPFSLSLMLDAGSVPGLKKPVVTKTAEEALKDPNEALRPKYVAEGEYKIVVEIGENRVEEDWRLR
jgi:photosystem II stability/assembly factor-like uncharacterized protein